MGKSYIKRLWMQCSLLILGAIVMFLSQASPSFSQVKVKGYIKKDGTYVKPYYRSNPDGNPYNNYSFPGNVNPYTGETATGNPDTYLENYYVKKSDKKYTPYYYKTPSKPSESSETSYADCSPSTLYPGFYFDGYYWYSDSMCKNIVTTEHVNANNVIPSVKGKVVYIGSKTVLVSVSPTKPKMNDYFYVIRNNEIVAKIRITMVSEPYCEAAIIEGNKVQEGDTVIGFK